MNNIAQEERSYQRRGGGVVGVLLGQFRGDAKSLMLGSTKAVVIISSIETLTMLTYHRPGGMRRQGTSRTAFLSEIPSRASGSQERVIVITCSPPHQYRPPSWYMLRYINYNEMQYPSSSV